MKMIKHMSLSIAGALRNYKGKSMEGLLEDEKGNALSDAEVREYLAECQLKGWKKIPCGDCEGFDPFDKGCPGHPINEENDQP